MACSMPQCHSSPYTGARLTRALAIDCESVGCGPNGKKQAVARVSVVNERGECVYDTFVKAYDVFDYRTWLTGITPENVKNGRDFSTVHYDIQQLLTGRIVVGHALHNDFRVLYYTHPEHLVRDTSKYDPFKAITRHYNPSLRELANVVLGKTIQTGFHDSIEDARTAMELYQTEKKVWEESEYSWPTLPGR